MKLQRKSLLFSIAMTMIVTLIKPQTSAALDHDLYSWVSSTRFTIETHDDGTVYIEGSSWYPSRPSNLCYFNSADFAFDSTSKGGRQMLTLIYFAKASGKSVKFFYTPSSKPGTSKETGCTLSTMAILKGVYLGE